MATERGLNDWASTRYFGTPIDHRLAGELMSHTQGVVGSYLAGEYKVRQRVDM